MVTSIDDCYEIIERLRNERNDLRRQLIGMSGMAIDTISDAISTDLIYENITLRRQLETAQAELDQVRQERDRARRALHLRDLEDTGLYDAYGQSLK